MPQIIFELLTEVVTGLSQRTSVLNYVLSVAFFNVKNTEIKFNSCGITAKKLSALLWGMRAGICGYIAIVDYADKTLPFSEYISTTVLDPVQNGHTINMLCPMICILRNMMAKKPNPNSYENTYAPCKILRKISIPFVAGGPYLVAGGPPWWQGDFFYLLKLRRIQKKSPCHPALWHGDFVYCNRYSSTINDQ